MYFTDLNKKKWIEALPGPARPYIYLARLDRPIGIWLLLLPGWWSIVLAAGGNALVSAQVRTLFLMFAIGAVAMRSAGCVINDLWDREFDRNVERTRLRPLAAGTISVRSALVFLAVLLCAGLIILLQMNRTCMALGFLALPLICLYPLAKRWTWWPQLLLGIVFNFGALMGWIAMTGALSTPAICLYAGSIFWTLAYDTVYAHLDAGDDTQAGVKSLALRLGRHGFLGVNLFYGMAMLFFLVAFLDAFKDVFRAAFLLLPAAHGFLVYRNWQPENPASSLVTFKSSRDTGLLILFSAFLASL